MSYKNLNKRYSYWETLNNLLESVQSTDNTHFLNDFHSSHPTFPPSLPVTMLCAVLFIVTGLMGLGMQTQSKQE